MPVKRKTKNKQILNNACERYKAMYMSSWDAIMTLEPPTWKFTSGNPAAVKMFGVKNEKEFVSLGPNELSPQNQPDGKISSSEALRMINKAMKSGSAFFEWTHKRYKGSSFPATVLLTRFKFKDKYILEATVRDISEQKEIKERLKETQQRFEEIFNYSPVAFEFYNAKGELIMANKACLDLFGLKSQKSVLGFKLFQDPNISEKLKKDLKKGKLIKYESAFDFEKVKENNLYKSSKQGVIFLDVVIAPVKYGKAGFFAIIKNVTKEKESQKKLEDKFKEIERINKLMIGRELKMIELKNEIKKLKA